MRHFAAYHNTQLRGRAFDEDEPFELLTNKPVLQLLGNTVWFFVGEGESSKQYSLGSTFVVNEVGESAEADFKHFARGVGYVFQPMPVLNHFEWFRDFFKSQAHFSLGVQEIQNQKFVDALIDLTSRAGFQDILFTK